MIKIKLQKLLQCDLGCGVQRLLCFVGHWCHVRSFLSLIALCSWSFLASWSFICLVGVGDAADNLSFSWCLFRTELVGRWSSYLSHREIVYWTDSTQWWCYRHSVLHLVLEMVRIGWLVKSVFVTQEDCSFVLSVMVCRWEFVMHLVLEMDKIGWLVKSVFVTQKDCSFVLSVLVSLQIFCLAFSVGNGQNWLVGKVGICQFRRVFIEQFRQVGETADSLSLFQIEKETDSVHWWRKICRCDNGDLIQIWHVGNVVIWHLFTLNRRHIQQDGNCHGCPSFTRESRQICRYGQMGFSLKRDNSSVFPVFFHP